MRTPPTDSVDRQQGSLQGRVFHGWYIVAVATAGAFLSGSLTSQIFFSVILKPLSADMGWSRTEISGAITLGTLCAGLISPLGGALADRVGARYLAPAGALVVCCALLLIASVQSLLVFYAAYILARGFGSTCLAGVVTQTIAVNWFRQMRGRVLGLIAMAVPLGSSFGAIAAQPIMDAYGWRTIFWVGSGVLLVGFILPALWLYRSRPEDLGLLPDGRSAPGSAGEEVAGNLPEQNWTASEAFRTRALWLLVAAMVLGRLAGGAVTFHLVAFYTDQGLSAALAASSIGLYAFMGAIANLIWGFLVERMSERPLLVAAMVLSGLSLLFMLPTHSPLPALVLAALFGFAGRGEGTLVTTVLAQYFGRASFGRIMGSMAPFNMAALGLGPLVASIAFDLVGSYTGVFAVFSCAYLAAALLLSLVRAPSKRVELR